MHFPVCRVMRQLPTKGRQTPKGQKKEMIMKRITGLTAAALLSASMFTAPALAQVSIDAGAGTDTGIGIDAGGISGGADIDAGAAGGLGVETGGAGAAAGGNADAGAEGATTLPGLDDGTTAAIGGDVSFDSAISAIEGGSASAAAIEAMTEVDGVNVVRIGELENSDSAELDAALSANQTGVEELRSSIEANAELSQELQTQGVEVASVVAAQVEADGALTLFVDEQEEE
jgi:hypothetical protein